MLTKLLQFLFPAVFKKVKSLPPSPPEDFVMRQLNPKKLILTNVVEQNLRRTALLYLEICKILKHTPKINSGYRSLNEQALMYQRMGCPAPMGSAHCIGAAVDLADIDGAIFRTLSMPENLLALGIYLEAKSATPTWCHVQFTPPKSGKRIFNP